MCKNTAASSWANKNELGVFHKAKQAPLLVVQPPKHDSWFKLLGKHPGRQGGSWENFTKEENLKSKQTRSFSQFYSVLAQPNLLTSTRDFLLSFREGKRQDVFFQLQLESTDLDIIKALNKNVFANRAV